MSPIKVILVYNTHVQYMLVLLDAETRLMIILDLDLRRLPFIRGIQRELPKAIRGGGGRPTVHNSMNLIYKKLLEIM